MTDPHPSFPNPVITEALCELHVRGSDKGDAWPTDLVGDFYGVMQPDYGRLEPLPELGVEVSLTEAGLNQRILAPKSRFRFHHAERALAVHLAPGIVSVNVLAPYPGWDSFRREILATWTRAIEVIHPLSVVRIGLRYINRIPNRSVEDLPSVWLRATGFLPQGALRYASGYSARTEVRTDEFNRIIVSLQHEPSAVAVEPGTVLFDIDRILERDLPTDLRTLGSEVDVLHEDVWRIFADAKTDRLSHLMSA